MERKKGQKEMNVVWEEEDMDVKDDATRLKRAAVTT